MKCIQTEMDERKIAACLCSLYPLNSCIIHNIRAPPNDSMFITRKISLSLSLWFPIHMSMACIYSSNASQYTHTHTISSNSFNVSGYVIQPQNVLTWISTFCDFRIDVNQRSEDQNSRPFSSLSVSVNQ